MIGMLKAVVSPITAVGNILDNLFTSDEEKLTHSEIMARVHQAPHIAQTEINKVEAQHRSIFVAGWRPFIGWVCGINLAYLVCLREWGTFITLALGFNIDLPTPVGAELTGEIVVALLGLGGLRTVEKITGRAK